MILPLLEPPAASPANTLDEYVSASRLNLWLKCPLAFRLRYIDGVVSPPSPTLYLGKLVHAGLERHYRLRQVGVVTPLEDFCGELPALWPQVESAERDQLASVADVTELDQQAAGLVRAYLQQLPNDEPRPLAVEATLRTPLIDPATGENLGIDLLGIVDLLLPQPAGPLVVDFKTASRGGEMLDQLHEVQLSSYSYLLRQATGMVESGLEIRTLVKTRQPRIERHEWAPRSDRHIRRLFAMLRAYLDDLDRRRFICRPGLGCSYCDYRETHCREWAG